MCLGGGSGHARGRAVLDNWEGLGSMGARGCPYARMGGLSMGQHLFMVVLIRFSWTGMDNTSNAVGAVP